MDAKQRRGHETTFKLVHQLGFPFDSSNRFVLLLLLLRAKADAGCLASASACESLALALALTLARSLRYRILTVCVEDGPGDAATEQGGGHDAHGDDDARSAFSGKTA